jgi:outer membrane lipoprotein-sorting protein
VSLFADHPIARWALPAGAVVLIAAGSLVATRTASADSGLPPRTAAQLLVDVRTATERSLSGTVVQTANLGLPQIPGISAQAGGGPFASAGGADLVSVLAGTHTWRVWADGPTKARVALIGGSGESDIIRNGSDVWVWSSQAKTATHHTIDARTAPGGAPSTSPTDLPKTPDEAARQALAAIDPTTQVSIAGTAVVAGRQAYELVLDPRSTATRVAQVRIAVDADTHIPLRVQVYSTKLANPAVEVGFTAIDFATPDARQFAFTPPPGTTVTEGSYTTGGKATVPNPAKPANPATPPAGTNAPEPKVVGTGWERVLVATLPTAGTGGSGSQPGQAGQSRELQGLLGSIPEVSGTWGKGRVIDGTLFSAVLTDDGRIAVGAVAPDALFAALKAS